MNKPHKHAEIIKAWADGAEIQYKSGIDNYWWDIKSPEWQETTEYRIKGENKVIFCTVSPTQFTFILNAQLARPNLKLTFDCDTNELKLAEVL